MQTDHPIPVEVYSGSLVEAQLLRNKLAEAGIESYLKDEHLGFIAP